LRAKRQRSARKRGRQVECPYRVASRASALSAGSDIPKSAYSNLGTLGTPPLTRHCSPWFTWHSPTLHPFQPCSFERAVLNHSPTLHPFQPCSFQRAVLTHSPTLHPFQPCSFQRAVLTHSPTLHPYQACRCASTQSAWRRRTSTSSCRQRLTLVHFSAQLERVLWDRGCA